MQQVCVFHRFEDLPAGYEAALRASSGQNVFLSPAWFRHLFNTGFGKHASLRLYLAGSEDESPWRGLLLPMSHAGERNFLAPRRLTSLSNFYTPFFAPLMASSWCERGAQEDMCRIAAAVASERPRWDMVLLYPMDPQSPIFSLALHAFRRAGMMAASYFCFGNWYLRVAGRSFEQYFQKLPSRLRNPIARKTRQLERAGRLQVRIVTSLDEVEEAAAAYLEVYERSWKQPEPYLEFMRGFIRLCAERGCLRLGLAYIDGTIAASQFWIVEGRVASIYKLAYDERHASLSVGSILTSQMMRHVIDIDRVQEVDYLAGDDAYKRDWMSDRRERWGIVAFNLRTMRGVAAAARHVAARAVRSAISGMRGLGKKGHAANGKSALNG